MSNPVPASAKVAAKAFAAAIGGRPSVRRYHADEHDSVVDIAEMPSCPEPGLHAVSSLGLHLSPNHTPVGDLRVELVMVAWAADSSRVAQAVASACFYVMRNGWAAQPGAVFMDLMRENDPSAEIPHLLWVAPSPWRSLGSVDLGNGMNAHWLLGLPIYESERQRLLSVGLDALEQHFEVRDLAYFDLNRAPVA